MPSRATSKLSSSAAAVLLLSPLLSPDHNEQTRTLSVRQAISQSFVLSSLTDDEIQSDERSPVEVRMQDAADDARCLLASLFPFSSRILPRDLSAEGQGPRLSPSHERALKAGRPHRGPRSLSHAPRSGAALSTPSLQLPLALFRPSVATWPLAAAFHLSAAATAPPYQVYHLPSDRHSRPARSPVRPNIQPTRNLSSFHVIAKS